MKKLSFIFFFIVLFTLLLFSSCESLTDPGKISYQYSIAFNLTSSITQQRAYVFKVSSNVENGKFGKYFTNEAVIQLRDNNSLITDFYPSVDSNSNPYLSSKFYYTNSAKLEVIPNTRYFLTIKIKNMELKGTTTVPDNFMITMPVNNQTIIASQDLLSFNISWTRSKNAGNYVINVRQVEGDLKYAFNTTDTNYEFSTRDFVTGKWRIEVLACDKNFTNHQFNNAEVSSIQGAYGYFGSSVLKTININVKKFN